MDIRTLVVGQDVRLVSGIYGKMGRVVEVTPSGVIVQLALAEGPIRPEGPELIRFDANGKACDSRDVYKGNMEWNGIPGTFECGPWELEDTPTRQATMDTIKLGPHELHLSTDPFILSKALMGLCVRGELVPGAIYVTNPLYSTFITALIMDGEGRATLFCSDSSVVPFASVEDAREFVKKACAERPELAEVSNSTKH